MSLDRCLFLARVHRADERGELAQRVERLARWHGGAASCARVGDHGLAGVVRYDEQRESLDEPVAFGEPARVADLVSAPLAELRALDGATAVLAIQGGRACLVAGAGAPGMLFAASSEGVEAWSTHAVAAAWLAQGLARVDPSAIPEQLAAEFVGGGRSLVEGAVPLAQAVRVTVESGGSRVEDFWPLAERWAPVPEDEAAAHAERHLLAELERRVPAGAYASLTAGLDSRVVAVALRELGIAPRAFTWGEPDWDDVRGGAALARGLGLHHELVGIEWLADDSAMREVRRQVRWNEGAIPVGFGRLDWPLSMPAFVTGAGGEIGRAFYYRGPHPGGGRSGVASGGRSGVASGGRSGVASRGEHAEPDELAGALVRLLEPRLAGARREATGGLARSLRGWVAAAADAGVGGWRTLDVVYGEQRLRRWLRGMLPRLEAPMIPAFATPEVSRALASLPLDQRLTDGFHLGFLARHAPDLVPQQPPPPRRTVRDRLPARLRPPPHSPLRPRWADHPGFRDWIADGVLRSPLVVEPLGERWAERTRRRFLAGDARAEGLALAAGGPVALAEALEELGREA